MIRWFISFLRNRRVFYARKRAEMIHVYVFGTLRYRFNVVGIEDDAYGKNYVVASMDGPNPLAVLGIESRFPAEYVEEA